MNKQVVLKSNRLDMRPICLEDAREMFLHFASDARVCKYLPWSIHKSISYTQGKIKHWMSDECEKAHLVVRRDNRFIGIISFSEKRENVYQVGYAYIVKAWGHGYASEALECLLDYLFNTAGAKAVMASYYAPNTASYNVMRKCGMSKIYGEKEVVVNSTGEVVKLYTCSITRGCYDTYCNNKLKNALIWHDVVCSDTLATDDDSILKWVKTGTDLTTGQLSVLRKLYSYFDVESVDSDELQWCKSIVHGLPIALGICHRNKYAVFVINGAVLLVGRYNSSVLLYTNAESVSAIMKELKRVVSEVNICDIDVYSLLSDHMYNCGAKSSEDVCKELLRLVCEVDKKFDVLKLRELLIR